MKEEERKEINLCLDIINIDNMINNTIDLLQKRDINDIDILGIETVLKTIQSKLNVIKKYDLNHETIQAIINQNKNELKEEQQKAINDLLTKK